MRTQKKIKRELEPVCVVQQTALQVKTATTMAVAAVYPSHWKTALQTFAATAVTAMQLCASPGIMAAEAAKEVAPHQRHPNAEENASPT